MKMPPIGWAFFGLAVVILVGYVLNRGLYLGYDIDIHRLSDGSPMFHKECRYIHLNGMSKQYAGGEENRLQAEELFCPPLKNSK